MAQEVESYLMEKFSKGLQSSKLRLNKELQELKNVLEEKIASSTPSQTTLRENLYYLNNVLAECKALSSKTFLTPEEIYSLYKIKQNLKTMKKELKNSRESNRTTPDGNVSPPQNGQPNSSNVSSPQNGQADSSDVSEIRHGSSQSVDPSKVYGLDDEIMSMVKLLVKQGSNNKFKAVGITGMGGIGKTTLCQVLLTRQEVKNHFVPRIWVCMSKKAIEGNDIKLEIVKRMLDSLGVEEETVNSIAEKQGLSGLVCALHVQLMGKRYLIVLDDAWETDEWYQELNSCLPRNVEWKKQLAYGLPKGYGGTVIVTSRNEELTKVMIGEENIHRLWPLSDLESCWSIFKDAVEEGGTQFGPPDMEDLKKEIIQKCAGFPLAAKMMGQIMNGSRTSA